MASLTRLRPFSSQIRHTPNPFSLLSSPSHPLQIYLTPITDPFINLAIEHHLLTHSHPASTILFLYANHPSVVIGRNQNPWLEADLAALRAGLPTTATPPHQQQPIPLVRRRSGGGAVFHDAGNANWSVICPPPAFTRTKHGDMVARALRSLGVASARVNARHDIVVDDPRGGGRGGGEGEGVLKVSGSAYKLTRLRALHHGTCLLESPNLERMGRLLRSPAAGFVKARGVESVRSRVGNVGTTVKEFWDAVREEFGRMYPGEAAVKVVEDTGEGVVGMPEELVRGYEELKSPEWIYGQTPQFTFSTHPSDADPHKRPNLPDSLPPNFRATFTVRHGKLQDVALSGLAYREDVDSTSQDAALSKALVGRQFTKITSWVDTLSEASVLPLENDAVGSWLNQMFGIAPSDD